MPPELPRFDFFVFPVPSVLVKNKEFSSNSLPVIRPPSGKVHRRSLVFQLACFPDEWRSVCGRFGARRLGLAATDDLRESSTLAVVGLRVKIIRELADPLITNSSPCRLDVQDPKKSLEC